MTFTQLLKSELNCTNCDRVLQDPVMLPCLCVICKGHLPAGSANDSSIECKKCQKCFDIQGTEFPAIKRLANILTKELHLSMEEKTLRKTFQDMIEQLKQLQNEVYKKQADLEIINYDHFSEIRRQIDILREEMKKKIDDIFLKVIYRTKETEKAYKLRMHESFLKISDDEFKKSSQLFMDEFRRPNLILENVKRLMSEQELHILQLEAKLADFNALNTEIESVELRNNKVLGTLKLKLSKPLSKLVSTSSDNTIKIWDLDTYECISTLVGHTKRVNSLEWLGNRRIASGCEDGTIKIWDTLKKDCLKTLVGKNSAIICLKTLNANTIASGSFCDIKIWNIDSGTCVQTLKGHTDWIRSLTQLHDGSLVSCSDDKTIKVWDMASGSCIESLDSPTKVVCLRLLPDGRLVSGSLNDLIHLWNMESGEIITTLRGHSGSIWHLETLESGELVSCSYDGTIKVWDLDKATCIKTLHGHPHPIMACKVGANNKLISFSIDGTIQVWSLDTCERIHKINDHDFSYYRDLLVI